jgi:NitT/TauT family transport system substrate-binding protein
MSMFPRLLRVGATRAAVVVALIVGLVVAGCSATSSGPGSGSGSSSAAASNAIKVSIATSKGSLPGLPMIVAQQEGFFAKHGINAELITSLRGGAAIMSALTSGSAQIVAQTVSASAQAKQKGATLPVIASLSGGVPYVLVVGKKYASAPAATTGENGWQATIKALKGATISASGQGTAFDIILKALFRKAGLSESDYHNINIAHGGPEVAALKTGQVGAAMVDIGNALSLVSEAGGHVVMDLSKQGPSWVTNQAWSGFLSSEAVLKAHPDLTQRFAAVMADVRTFYQNPANISELHRIAVSVSGIPDNPGLDNALRQYVGLMLPSFSTAQVRTTIDFMVDTGQLKATPPVKPADIVLPTALA